MGFLRVVSNPARSGQEIYFIVTIFFHFLKLRCTYIWYKKTFQSLNTIIINFWMMTIETKSDQVFSSGIFLHASVTFDKQFLK